MKKLNIMLSDLNKNKIVYIMIFPSVLFLAVFVLYPLAWALKFMFYEYNGMMQPRFIGMENFVRLFTRDLDFWKSVMNTVVYSGGKLLLTLPLSFILAVILNSKLKGRDFFRITVFMPTIISTAVMSLIFYFIFNSYNGIVNQLLLRFELIDTPLEWLGTKMAMFTSIIVASWGAIGNYMIYFLAGLQSIPDELYESAAIDGTNWWQALWHITLPMMGPVLQVVVMLAIIISLKGYESIMILTAGGPGGVTDVMYLYIYKLFFPLSEIGGNVTLQYGYGSAVAFVSSIIVGLITVGYLYWSKKMNEVF
ncbi:MAG: carbohydrate ABC transporter permease [Bacteroidota bacterium]